MTPAPPGRSWLLTPTPLPVDHPAATHWRWLLPGTGAALQWLDALGLRRGERIALAAGNTPECAALLQAAPLAGLTVVLISRRLAPDEAAAQARRAQAAVLLCAADYALATAPDARQMPAAFATDVPLASGAPLAGHEPALVIFTSGTSGRAKGARLSWDAIRHAADAAVDTLALGPADTWLGCLPLDHIGGASVIYRAGRSGCAVRLLERFAAEDANAALAAGCTGASVVPTMLHRMLAARGDTPWPATLRVLLTGGGPLAAELIAASTRLGLAPSQTYGLTETASQVCTLLPGEAAAHAGSAGRPLPGMEVRIAGAGADGVGGIEVRGASLFSGYEDDGFRPHPPGTWFATGDLGSRDDEGHLRVHCRRDDLILSGGENVYPAEVEAALARHPAVAEAGVYALPDAEWGQVAAAVLVARGERPTDDEFSAWCRRHLPAGQRPQRWRWAATLPRTATGKLQRQRLATWAG
jgi:O-succinylbenzoic acid--CoA ligase